MEHVVLVDDQDREIGIEEKLQAHVSGKLHRAISVFLFNKNQEMLMQKRANGKYHSGGLWSNACCSHPRMGETPLDAATRRLWEEMGIRCEVEKAFHFIYRASLDKNLTEYEYDHVFVGQFDGEPTLNPLEASEWKWIGFSDLQRETVIYPERFTFWFRVIWQSVYDSYLSLPDQPSLVRKVEK